MEKTLASSEMNSNFAKVPLLPSCVWLDLGGTGETSFFPRCLMTPDGRSEKKIGRGPNAALSPVGPGPAAAAEIKERNRRRTGESENRRRHSDGKKGRFLFLKPAREGKRTRTELLPSCRRKGIPWKKCREKSDFFKGARREME